MKILARIMNPVDLSYVQALLKDAGIECLVMDSGMNSMQLNPGTFAQRVMVIDEDLERAQAVLRDAGLSYGSAD